MMLFFGMDWLSRHRVVLDCLKARVHIAGANGIFIACKLHTEELWNIRTKRFLATISMVKDDGQHELQDLPVIAEYEDIFVTFGTVTTRHMRRSCELFGANINGFTSFLSSITSRDDRVEKAIGGTL